MRVIAIRPLRAFWKTHPDAEQPLKAWHREAKTAIWEKPSDIKARYRTASVVGDNRVVFNIGGNKYRLVVRFHYAYGIAYIRFICTHPQYDRIDVETI